MSFPTLLLSLSPIPRLFSEALFSQFPPVWCFPTGGEVLVSSIPFLDLAPSIQTPQSKLESPVSTAQSKLLQIGMEMWVGS